MPRGQRKGNEESPRENVRRLRRRIRIDRPTSREARATLRAYFEGRLQRLRVVRTTRTPGGQVLDWIDRRSQVTGGEIASPPPDAGPLVHARGKLRDGRTLFELENPRIGRGPEGTVPVVRKNLRALRSTRAVADYLSKHGRKSYQMMLDDRDTIEVPGDASSHLYAYTAHWVTCYGSEGYLNIYDPYLQWDDEFSLHQIALARGSGSGKQTIEAGWQEYRDLYGDWVPHLFIYYTTNGYSNNDDNEGGYNRDVDGWVQYSNVIYPEARFSNHSVRGGSQYVFRLKVQLWQENWWIRIQDEWIGYYPASLFSNSGLRSEAEKVAFYGEIVDSGDHASATHSDMGSGYFPDHGWQWSSYMRNLRYQSDSGGAMSTYDADTTFASDSDKYDLITHMNSGSSWGSYFWLGGPGGG